MCRSFFKLVYTPNLPEPIFLLVFAANSHFSRRFGVMQNLEVLIEMLKATPYSRDPTDNNIASFSYI